MNQQDTSLLATLFPKMTWIYRLHRIPPTPYQRNSRPHHQDAGKQRSIALWLRKKRRENRKKGVYEIAGARSPIPPMKPCPVRTSYASSADVHIARLRGEMPSRALWRKMQRIRERAKHEPT